MVLSTMGRAAGKWFLGLSVAVVELGLPVVVVELGLPVALVELGLPVAVVELTGVVATKGSVAGGVLLPCWPGVVKVIGVLVVVGFLMVVGLLVVTVLEESCYDYMSKKMFANNSQK